MTEPEHIPLTARLRQYAEGKAEEFRHLLQVPDDALVHLGDAPEPEVWGGGCECWVTPEHMWTTHYGAVEPGSQLEFNPECPKHGAPPLPTDAELAAEYDRARGYDRPLDVQAAEAREDIRAYDAAKAEDDERISVAEIRRQIAEEESQ